MNKTTAIITFTAALLTAFVGTMHGEGSAEPADLVKVFLLDDQSGPELQALHGIQPVKIEDLEVIVNAVLDGNIPVQLIHQAVDEDASDNPLAEMLFTPFASGPPPVRPNANMPLQQYAEASKEFRRDREIWDGKIGAYGQKIVADAEAFIRRVISTQDEVTERFSRMLATRNGRDFNRSDIYGSLIVANRVLGSSGRRVLILNSDCKDEPGKRKPKTTPLTVTDLDRGIELIFVNTSHLPEQAPLFKGIPNKTLHANSIREAMETVCATLKLNEIKSDSVAAAAGDRNSAQ